MKAGHFVDSPEVMEFVNSSQLHDLAPLGTSCPDHFIRTKIRPLIVPHDADARRSTRWSPTTAQTTAATTSAAAIPTRRRSATTRR